MCALRQAERRAEEPRGQTAPLVEALVSALRAKVEEKVGFIFVYAIPDRRVEWSCVTPSAVYDGLRSLGLGSRGLEHSASPKLRVCYSGPMDVHIHVRPKSEAIF